MLKASFPLAYAACMKSMAAFSPIYRLLDCGCGRVTNFARQYTLAFGGPYCDCGYQKKRA